MSASSNERVLRVLAPGMLTTVQDLGRTRYAHLGVSVGGAADALSARLANRLVGNQDDEAVLEMTLTGGTFEFNSVTSLAITGAAMPVEINGASAAMFTTHFVQPGDVLKCGPITGGARAYLAVSGGLEIRPVLGSRSTQLNASLGGFEGRALRRGDEIPLRAPAEQRRFAVPQPELILLTPRTHLRVTHGTQFDWFGRIEHLGFVRESWRVSNDSNRMGIRLAGGPVTPPKREMVSEGVTAGAVQIPPSGEPIILFVEQQTTGGYPQIANVITADLPAVGQLRPGDSVTFEFVNIYQAVQILREQEAQLDSILVEL